MAQWMIAQMDSGRVADERLWSNSQTHAMWTMHTPIPVSRFYTERLPSMHFRGYGLGWELGTLHGRKTVGHSGGYDGMISRQILVPEEKLGIFKPRTPTVPFHGPLASTRSVYCLPTTSDPVARFFAGTPCGRTG